MKVFRRFIADAYYPSVEEIPTDKYKEAGFKLVIFDFDNTLNNHGEKSANNYVHDMITRWQDAGFEVYLISNAKKERGAKIQETLDVKFMADARKPGIDAFLEIEKLSTTPKDKFVFCGDQLFTDVWAGKNFGVKTILVDPLSRDEPYYIKLKRFLENVVKLFTGKRRHYDNILN